MKFVKPKFNLNHKESGGQSFTDMYHDSTIKEKIKTFLKLLKF